MDNLADTYAARGYAGPLTAFAADELAGVAEAMLEELRANDYSLCAKRNRHLDWPPAQRLSAAPAIIECASQLLGDDLILWRTNIFASSAGRGFPWHQDQYRTLLQDTTRQISVHLAVSEAPAANCVMLLPGSHLMADDELARAGFNMIAGTDEDAYGAPNYWRDPNRQPEIVRMTLRPGEFFIFHPSLLHASVDLTHPPIKSRRPGGIAKFWSRLHTPAIVAEDSRSSVRVGFALRITVAANAVFPAAFAESLPRIDRSVPFKLRV